MRTRCCTAMSCVSVVTSCVGLRVCVRSEERRAFDTRVFVGRVRCVYGTGAGPGAVCIATTAAGEANSSSPGCHMCPHACVWSAIRPRRAAHLVDDARLHNCAHVAAHRLVLSLRVGDVDLCRAGQGRGAQARPAAQQQCSTGQDGDNFASKGGTATPTQCSSLKFALRRTQRGWGIR